MDGTLLTVRSSVLVIGLIDDGDVHHNKILAHHNSLILSVSPGGGMWIAFWVIFRTRI
jgi:hypothetical protein